MYKTLFNHIRDTNPEFTEDDFNMVIKAISIKQYPKKSVVWRQGDYVKGGGYVYKGCFRFFMTNSDGEERTTYFAFEDYWIGDYNSILYKEPSAQTVESLEDSIVLYFSKDEFKQLLDQCVGFRNFTLIKRSKAYNASLNRIVDLHEPAETRYLNLMKKYPGALNRIPLYHIASYLGIKPESLSRLRKKMSEEGK